MRLDKACQHVKTLQAKLLVGHVSSCGHLLPWYHVAMVSYCYGIMLLWYHVAMVSCCHGILLPVNVLVWALYYYHQRRALIHVLHHERSWLPLQP